MATSLRLPKALLDAVDRKARTLGINRDQLIVGALEHELQTGANWSPGFFQRLADVDAGTAADVDELLDAVVAARKSKAARRQ